MFSGMMVLLESGRSICAIVNFVIFRVILFLIKKPMEVKTCIYRDEKYSVREDGSIMRHLRQNQRLRKLDDTWTFGNKCSIKGYMKISSVPVHRIVATAFHGDPPTNQHVVDHIDTNRCNNHFKNLRWLTKLENLIKNDITRKKIEYRIGCPIDEFLKNPKKYYHLLNEPSVKWMRTVTLEDAKSTLEFYRNFQRTERERLRSQSREAVDSFATKPIQSKNSNAKQINWKDPSYFFHCPEDSIDVSLADYARNLKGQLFLCEGRYGKTEIIQFDITPDKKKIVVKGQSENVKPYVLISVTYENGFFVHRVISTYFQKDGLDKYYNLELGIEWKGGEVFDDSM